MNHKIFWLYITIFINILGFGMIFPLLPLFAEKFKASFFDIGIIAATYSFAQFLVAPFMGRLSDRFGRKPMLIVSVLGSIAGYLILAGAQSLPLIFLSRLVQGLSSAGNFPTAQAYIADITSKEERTVYMGKVAAVFAIGTIFGPVFGGIFGAQNFSLAFLVGAALSFLNLILIFVFLPESLTKKAEKLVLREGFLNFKAIYHGLRGDFGVLFFILFSWAFYVSNFQVAIPLFTEHRFAMSAFEIGLFFSLTGIVAGITQWFILPIVIKRIEEIKTIFVGLILMIIGQILAAVSPHVSLFYLFFILSVAGSGLNRPVVNAILSKKTHEGQGTTFGLAFSFESLGRTVAPIFAGMSMEKLGFQSPFWLTAAILAASLFLFWQVEMRKRRP